AAGRAQMDGHVRDGRAIRQRLAMQLITGLVDREHEVAQLQADQGELPEVIGSTAGADAGRTGLCRPDLDDGADHRYVAALLEQPPGELRGGDVDVEDRIRGHAHDGGPIRIYSQRVLTVRHTVE